MTCVGSIDAPMTRRTLAAMAIVALWIVTVGLHVRAADALARPEPVASQPESPDVLARQVYDIFRQQCIKCHGAAKAGGLDLRSEEGLRKGGNRGPVVVAHRPDDSDLFKQVSHVEAPFMPAGAAKLPDESIDPFAAGSNPVASIATVPEASPEAAAAAAELAKLEERPITDAERAYWAFVKAQARGAVRRSRTRRGAAIRSTRFCCRRWKPRGLTPSAPG